MRIFKTWSMLCVFLLSLQPISAVAQHPANNEIKWRSAEAGSASLSGV